LRSDGRGLGERLARRLLLRPPLEPEADEASEVLGTDAFVAERQVVDERPALRVEDVALRVLAHDGRVAFGGEDRAERLQASPAEPLQMPGDGPADLHLLVAHGRVAVHLAEADRQPDRERPIEAGGPQARYVGPLDREGR